MGVLYDVLPPSGFLGSSNEDEFSYLSLRKLLAAVSARLVDDAIEAMQQ